MAYEFKAQRRVEFSDTDMAGIMHYANFFRFMETAENGFYRSLGFSVVMKETDPRLGWPRVHASFDFHRALRFEDEFEIRIRIVAIDEGTISYSCVLSRGETRIATGRFTIACASRQPNQPMRRTAIPPEIRARLAVAPPDAVAPGWAPTDEEPLP